MAMLVPLGIEKGNPFQPDARQKKILEEATFVGEAMAMAISFDKRIEGSRYGPDSNWQYVIMFDPSQEAKYYSQLDERTDYFYEAVTTTKGMVSKTPGVGQAYPGAYELASDVSRFDGSKNYRLHVPPNPPAKQFWSVTLYDVDTRSFIVTKELIADRSSRMDRSRMPTVQRTSTWGRRLPKDSRRTGFRPFPAGAGSRCSASIRSPL
jgi:hypothetical protein